jgi:transcriptional regulator with XRE-family HTH domain
MVVRMWHVGDVIRKMREQNKLTATSLATRAGVKRSVVLKLERDGPEVEGMTPHGWQVLDRLAAVLGLANGAALYKLVPEAVDPSRPRGSVAAANAGNRVLPFSRKR